MKNRRVVLDTNLWISFLISNRQQELDLLLESGAITLIFSEELLEEFLEVSNRPKFKRFFKSTDIEALIHQIDTNEPISYLYRNKEELLIVTNESFYQ